MNRVTQQIAMGTLNDVSRSEEAHAQFNFEELVLLEKREKTTLYLDPASQKNIEIFETEIVQETRPESVSQPLRKFRDVFQEHFPQLKDRNVQAEDIKALLKADPKFRYHHSTGGHDIFEIIATHERFPVPLGNREGVLSPGTLGCIRASMLRAMGTSSQHGLES